MNWAVYYQAYGDETYGIINWLSLQDITEDSQVLAILKAYAGLDGTFSEGYAGILAKLYRNDSAQWLRLAAGLDEDNVGILAPHTVYGLRHFETFEQNKADLERLLSAGTLTSAEAAVADKILYYMNLPLE
jgi:hypothetical protein